MPNKMDFFSCAYKKQVLNENQSCFCSSIHLPQNLIVYLRINTSEMHNNQLERNSQDIPFSQVGEINLICHRNSLANIKRYTY